jgi:hypothetical protein
MRYRGWMSAGESNIGENIDDQDRIFLLEDGYRGR